MSRMSSGSSLFGSPEVRTVREYAKMISEYKHNMWHVHTVREVGGWGRDPKKMDGERLGEGVEYHLMSPTPRR